MKTKILIVDDYHIFRRGLKLILEKEDDFSVVGEASDSNELFRILEIITPDVIVMDLMLPQKTVISISRQLHKKYPEIPFIIITVNAIEYTILECVINGASGIIWKENTVEQLLAAIRLVVSGERYFEVPESMVVNKVLHHLKGDDLSKLNVNGISDRETEVLILLAEGYSYKEIGDRLEISPRTVETHKNNTLSKLGLQSIPDLVKYAIKNNLIEL